MVRDLTIRPKAEAELSAAFNWYEDQVLGLGSDYLDTVETTLHTLQRNPETYPVVYNSIRRCLIRRFPYAIFYLVEPSKIIIIAVFHIRRNPASWKNRR